MTTTATRERPILFRPELVRAILDGPKRVTRRPVKPRDSWLCAPEPQVQHEVRPALLDSGEWGWIFDGCTYGIIGRCPYGAPGDRLWVRETWGVGCRPDPREGWRDGIEYRADAIGLDERDLLPLHAVDAPGDFYADYAKEGWRPSIFMPRWACRLVLRNDETRAERLLEITEEDALAEGLPSRAAFLAGWDRLYGKRPELQSAANPWVWRVEFSVVEPTP